VCSICCKVYKTISNLKKHRLTHVKRNDENNVTSSEQSTGTYGFGNAFNCRFCDMKFRSEGALSKHELIHVGNELYKCRICSKVFAENQVFLEHMNTHAKKHKYKCSFCKKTCVSNIDLKRHERVHTGERPFKCNVCEKTFKIGHHLKSHILTHKEATIAPDDKVSEAKTEASEVKTEVSTGETKHLPKWELQPKSPKPAEIT